MVTDIRPPGKKTAKSSAIIIAPAFVDPLNPTVAELTTAALRFECYLLPGQFNPTPADAVETDQRYCDDQVPGTFGATTWSIANIQYIYDPQTAGTVAGNKALGMLAKGALVWLAQRDAIDVGTAVVAGQILTALYPIETGTQGPTPVGAGGGAGSSKYTITQAVQIRDTVLQFVTVHA